MQPSVVLNLDSSNQKSRVLRQAQSKDIPGQQPRHAAKGLSQYLLLFWLLLVSIGLSNHSLAKSAGEDFLSSQKSNFTTSLAGLDEQVTFLPVDEAFSLSVIRQDKNQQLTVDWAIAPEYYLYRNKMAVKQLRNGEYRDLDINLPEGKEKLDEYFGLVKVFYGGVSTNLDQATAGIYKIEYQGCADAGLCYPPQTRYLTAAADSLTLSQEPPSAAPASSTVNKQETDLSTDSGFYDLLNSASLVKILGLFYLAGVALTFTPCVLPMVPILSSIIVNAEKSAATTGLRKRSRSFALTSVYVMAMASTYALAGSLTGYFGAEMNIQAKLQSPILLSLFSGLFIALALSMFGLFELRLPAFINDRAQAMNQRVSGGSYTGAAGMGVLSSLVVSPCVSAPLAGALVFISSTGDPGLGAAALFTLALGMGTPLLAIGAAGHQVLPKAGAWMDQVKIFFGVLLVGLAIWILARLVPQTLVNMAWSLLAVAYSFYLIKQLSPLNKAGWKPRLFAGVISLYTLVILLGTGMGSPDALNPTQVFAAQRSTDLAHSFTPVSHLEDLQLKLEQAPTGKPIMLDVYADWCVSCKILEQQVFTDPAVDERLAQMTLLRADVTRNSAEDTALLNSFKLFGPPGLLFFMPGQGELLELRIQGEIDAERLSQHLDRIIKRSFAQ